MKHRCQEAGTVKEVAAWVDQKTGSQLLWGKGWLTLLYGEKCTVPIFEMCYTYMNKTPITQVRQFTVYTGVHIMSILPMRCQECKLLSHSQQTLPSTVQQMMTWALSLDLCTSPSDSQLLSNEASIGWHWKRKNMPHTMDSWCQTFSHVVTAVWGSTMKMTGEVDLIARASLWPSHSVSQQQSLSHWFSFDIPITKGENLASCFWENAVIKEAQWNGWNPFSFSCCLSCPVSLVYPHPVLAQNKLTR